MKKGSDKTSHTKSKTKWETFNSKFWWRFGPFLLLLGVICWFPYWFTQFHWVNYDLRDYGTLGDAINGVMGPFIAMVAAGLTFIAFWVQYRANELQRDDIKLERFESKFYELVRMQNSTVSEFNINNIYFGRKSFLQMYEELRFCFFSIKQELEQIYHDAKEDALGFKIDDDKRILQIAYLIFFYGIGDTSDKLLKERLVNYCSNKFADNIIDGLKKKKINGRQEIKLKNGDKAIFDGQYIPFDGHISRLGHYYRLLFQAVKYVDNNEKLTIDEKRDYVRTLRAQLSAHEQVMLYYNIMTSLGKAWLAGKNRYDSLLIKYKMIKNIPLPLAEFGYPLREEFKAEVERFERENPGKKFYEWDEA
jgi:hypothetical protein